MNYRVFLNFYGMKGPNIEKLSIQFFHTMQVGQGPRHEKILCENFFINVRDGQGPQHREFQQEILQRVQVGQELVKIKI